MLTKQYGAASCPSKMDHTSETDSSEKIRITNSEFSATLNKLVWIWNFFFFWSKWIRNWTWLRLPAQKDMAACINYNVPCLIDHINIKNITDI